MASIGVSQLNKPAPLNYRRFTNAWIIGFVPGVASFVATWGFSQPVQIKIGVALMFATAIVKTVGIFLGNGQIYSPSNAVVDAKTNS